MDNSALASEMLRATFDMLAGMKKDHMHIKDLMRGEMHILRLLEHKNAPAAPGELSSCMNASSAKVAMALRSLEKKGFIRRSIDNEDRRKILVTMTEAGHKITYENMGIMCKKMKRIIDELGEEDAREYVRIAGRIAEITQGFQLTLN